MRARPGTVREVLRARFRAFPRSLRRPAPPTPLKTRCARMRLDLLGGVAAGASERVTLVAQYGNKEILIDTIIGCGLGAHLGFGNPGAV